MCDNDSVLCEMTDSCRSIMVIEAVLCKLLGRGFLSIKQRHILVVLRFLKLTHATFKTCTICVETSIYTSGDVLYFHVMKSARVHFDVQT